ncbi:divalent-cation tolerance protein CutA [Polynucleobacter sp. MWH-UH24A]|uniref:divalent-cation tolerance protein CutA n=1 Tax=Polynucleobacter sp. MWH-UH24A TaxID=2689110 RepID=UPI001BFD3260|nr:divalent-cation tolerance protein CutA [Polynucleobacter sp. MWH-UH24A]QWD76181.1 divalent-cation tolerance protein CutA [Polynucleobacter sp. MWH-UH24A]
MDPILIVTTTLPTMDAARLLGQQLIDERLAACVQIQGGVQSIYRWDGTLCNDTEVLLSAKTTATQWQLIEAFIKTHHPYQLPEIIAFRPAEYSQAYGQWVNEETRP